VLLLSVIISLLASTTSSNRPVLYTTKNTQHYFSTTTYNNHLCTAQKMKSGLVLLLAGSVTAFAPAAVRQQQPQHATATTTSNTALNLNIDSLPGATKPLGQWDPLGLAELGSASTAAWFRAAELKHARVAMLAVTGYIVQAAGYHFPGMLSSEVSFESLSTMKPLDAWCAVPSLGK